jgi:hypothetical protein
MATEPSVEALSATITSARDFGVCLMTMGKNFLRNASPFQLRITTAVLANEFSFNGKST